jgi:hypothetical protein
MGTDFGNLDRVVAFLFSGTLDLCLGMRILGLELAEYSDKARGSLGSSEKILPPPPQIP